MCASQLPTARLTGRRAPQETSPTVAVPVPDPAGDPNDTGDGLLLDRYRLGRRLGSGGFATVFAAHDERLDRPVAVKVLARNRVIQSRFEREARAAARLQHPAIVTLYEAVVDDDGAYLVTELVRGAALDTMLESGKLSDRDVVEIAISVADALEHAHAAGVIHRDVKPANVLIPARPAKLAGQQTAAKLTDFGVARVAGGDTLTRTGDVIGTVAYMSPEQAEGRDGERSGGGGVGPHSDLYSLALLIYEALTGVNPVADTVRAGRRRLGTYLPPLRRQRRDLPRELGAAIDLALRPRPAERGTIAELRAALLDSLPLLGEEPGVVAPARGVTEITRRDGVADPPLARFRDDYRAADTRSRPARVARSTQRQPPTAEDPRVVSRTIRGNQTLALAPAGILLWIASAVPVGLGFVALAGAWPGIVAATVASWWRRALLAAAGFAWLGIASALSPRNFYWAHASLSGPELIRAGEGAAIWALAAALWPLLCRGSHALADVAVTTGWAAATIGALTATGIGPLSGAVIGAVTGWFVTVYRPLVKVIIAILAARPVA